LAPYAPLPASLLAQLDPRPERVLALFAPVEDYDVRGMLSIAAESDGGPKVSIPLYEKAARLDPNVYFFLGGYLAALDRPVEAVKAFEAGVERAPDRVGVANGLRWLIGHYCDEGRLERARQHATMVADTYAAEGLASLGYFMERIGDYAAAEKWYRTVHKRYDDRRSLDEFYIRYQQRHGGELFKVQAAEAMARVFPKGLERVSRSQLTVPIPEDGAWIDGEHAGTVVFGLRRGDRVVAVNGFRIHNVDQYGCIVTFSDDLETEIIAARKAEFIEIKGPLRRELYGLAKGGPNGAGRKPAM
jgi:tetratricopeptide (TPR) repeat protein